MYSSSCQRCTAHNFSLWGVCHCCQNLIPPTLTRPQSTRISVPQQTYLSSGAQPIRYGELHPIEYNATASYASSTRWHKNSALAGRAHKIKRISPNIDMDMSYTRVLHIKVAYRVPHKWRHAFYVTQPLLCARMTCYVTVITHGRCYARA
jgi:hypothetical protein